MDEPPKRALRPKKEATAKVEQSEDFSGNEDNNDRELIRLLHPIVESFHSRKTDAGRKQYLVKYTGKSLANCQWIEESELLERDPTLKAKLKRFDGLFDAAPQDSDTEAKTLGIDADCANVDRILDCSEIFVLIHPKKASDLRSKWNDGLVRVMRALVNFNHQNIFYGVFYIQLMDVVKHYPELAEAVDFSVLLNRIYLDSYPTPDKFWEDLEAVFRAVDRLCLYIDEKSDLSELNERMKQLTAVLYSEWLDMVNSEAVVFSAKVTDRSFVDDLEAVKNGFKTMFEGGTASPATIVKLFEEYQHILKFKAKSNDWTFDQTALKVQHLKDSLSDHISQNNGNETDSFQQTVKLTQTEENPCPNFGNGDFIPHSTENGDSVIQQLENGTEMEIEHTESPQAVPVQSQTPSIQIPLSIPFPELLLLMSDINEFVVEKTNFLENVTNKAFWTDFLKQLSRLPTLPKFLSDLPAIDWTTTLPTIYANLEMLYLVKWSNMSYADCTWERESDLIGFDTKIRDYKRFTRAMDRETRKTFVNRFTYFNELQEITENQRTFERTSQSTLNDLRHKLFTYKDPKAVIQYTPKTQPIFKDQRMLRSYQLESLNWMIDAWTKRRNIILADEMGLGKTIQAMSFINHLIAFEHQPGPYLVIAPLSTLSHWKRVFEDWTHLNSILYYDSKGKAGREVCQNYEFNHWDITMKGLFLKDNHISKFSVMITSFEVFIQDFDTVFKTLPFQHIIIDEAHRLKNRNAKIISTLKRLVCQRISLLTGTPIQNNLSELWSLLHFIEPSVFNDLPKFLDNYENQMKLESLQKLQVALSPFLLRRMKEEVESSIPPLIETIIDVELTSVQKIVYKTLYEKNKGTLQKGLGFSGITLMNNLEMQLRKCCNHPFTIQDIAENLTKDCLTNDLYFQKLISCSGKMIFVDKALEKFDKEGKKVLIFSQFTEVLRLLEEYLSFKNFRYYKIDGSTKARDRQISIDKFNNSQNGFEVFLLSTKAGGLGINLTSASIVIIFDSDWNPQNDIQAIARAHRIGQTQEVKVFRLISKKTYESEMFERASKKLGLDQAILLASNYAPKGGSEGTKTDDFTKLKPDEIELLLRKGMIGLLHMTEEDSTGEAQFGQNIDDIIKTARTANYSVINGLYTFGKTKFVGNANDELLQIDDPDFWKKAFANQKTTIENFEKEYTALVNSDKIKKIDVQKDFFLRLSEELYRYLNDRVTNEGFSADTEIKLCDLLINIADNNKFNPVFRELASQLNADFNKGSRRIKKIDEKTLNALLKFPNTSDPSNTKTITDSNNESGKRKRQSSPASEASLGKRESMDDSDVYENEEEKIITNHKREKKLRQEEKLRICEFCGKKDDLISCNGFCGRLCHSDCLELDFSKHNGLVPAEVDVIANGDNKDTTALPKCVKPFEDGVCVYCRTHQTVCYECKQHADFSDQIFLQSEVGLRDLTSPSLFKCSVCPKFYHSACMVLPISKDPKTDKNEPAEEDDKRPKEFMCPQHFCATCGIYSKNMYQCVECPFASHKKCMSKRNKTLQGYKILCIKHQIKPEKIEKVLKVKVKEIKPVVEKTEKPKPIEKIAKTEDFKIKLTEKTPRIAKSKAGETNPKTQPSSEPKKEVSKLEVKNNSKRPISALRNFEAKPKMNGLPTKKIKQSVETNQKLSFGIFKPFDYSNYKKVS